MSNFRVVREYDSLGESFHYRIEDIVSEDSLSRGVHPFVQHKPGIPCGASVEHLRKILREMLKATRRPVLEHTTRRLVEVPELARKRA